MKNPDWGTKRTCQSCASKYYDLNREPAVCPKCQTEFDPASTMRLRSDSSYKASGGRAKSIFGKASPLGQIEAAPEEAADAEAEPREEDDEAEDADRDDEVVEDVSELGDDSADLAEIVEKDKHAEG